MRRLARAAALLAGGALLPCSCGDESASTEPRSGPEPVATTTRAPLAPALERLIAEHEQRVRAAPADALARARLAMVYEANALWAEARTSFDEAARLEPTQPLWVLHTATARLQLGQFDAALELLRGAAARFGNCAPLQVQLGDLLLDSGDARAALAAFELAVAAAPRACEAHAGLGEAKLELGDAAGAVRELEAAAQLDPSYRAARYLLGRAYRAAGQTAAAERELAIGAGEGKRRMEDALSDEIARYTVDLDRALDRGTHLLDSGRTTAAAALLEGHLAAHAEDARLQVNLGIAYLRLARAEDALRCFEAAARSEPDAFMVQVNLAACHLQLGHLEQARACAQRTLELAPSYAPAHLLAARAAAQLGDLGSAEQSLRAGERLDPQNLTIQQALGELYLAQGRDRDAFLHLRSSFGSVPDPWQAHARFAQLAFRLGELDEARRAVTRGLVLAPGEPVLVEMQAELDALGVR